jgi:hypothetical protein
MTTRRIVVGFVLSTAVALGSFSIAAAESLRPAQSAAAANGFPAARCSRPAEQKAERIKRLVEALQQSRAMAEQNPLLLADVGYYEAELAASRRCFGAVAAR